MKKRIFRMMLLSGGAAMLCLFLLCLLPGLIAGSLARGEALIFCTALVPAAAVLVLVSEFLSGKAVEPLTKMDPDDPDDAAPEELKPIVRKLIRQNGLIGSLTSQLKQRQEEFRAITENMTEGLLVTGKNGEILLYNSPAKQILDPDGAYNKNDAFALNDSPDFASCLSSALAGGAAKKKMILRERVYQLYANPLWIDETLSGAVMMLLDITEQEQRDSMRREFTSNVSHELKTPLTSIYGISEILADGIVKPEDIPRFTKNIHSETGRLITLVNDIIKLSQMDENSIMEDRTDVPLLDLAQRVCARLEEIAEEKNVTLAASGENAAVSGIPGILEEMIYNLVDNGIKYNVPGGSVNVTVEQRGGHPVVTVADTGIGIEPQHLGRIFERFYRVDKSHSKQVGGTGLGLSIVKHGAMFHGAHIDVSSTPGKGTAVSITF